MVKRKIKIAVLVSGGGTNLQALIDAEKNGTLSSGIITLVVSNKADAYALERAKKEGIATAVTKDEAKLIRILEDAKIEMIILAGYLKVLSADFCKLYENRIINVHPSLIPSFCGDGCYGLKVHEMALDYGVKVTGATVHYVNEVTDGGKIISQKAVYVKENDTPEKLQKRVMEQAEWIILPKAAETVAVKIRNEERKQEWKIDYHTKP
ncbi:MAG: phosphoribosylglycinamide formyltransferase [Eubacterium sp.]|nr:phosphoribosylglycinamide formyltransferase [Eubacterium sp.]